MALPEQPDSTSALEELRQKLYSNTAPESLPAQSHETPAAFTPGADVGWKPETPPPPKKKTSWSVLFLLGALAIFIIALAVAAYFLVFGGGATSSDRIDISVAPIPALRSGDVATLLVTVTNNNRTPITNTKFSIAFPESARDANNPLAAYPRFEDTIGDIPPGESRQQTVRVVLSGSTGEVVTLPLKLEYKTEGSNAVFIKEMTHTVTITSSPLSVTVQTDGVAPGGQEVALTVRVHSDSPVPLENVAVLAEYPFGFIPSKAGVSLFDIGTLAAGSDASVTVRGTLTGEDAAERVFRFSAGTKGTGNTLGIVYASGQGTVLLSRPFVATTFSVNGTTGTDLVVPAGKMTEVRLAWANTLPTDITNTTITVQLAGDALDASSVTASGGFYRSVDRTVLFAPDTNPVLANLAAGTVANGSFSFTTKAAGQNPSITALITVTGKNSAGGGAPTQLTSTMTKTILVGTELGAKVRASRTAGPFKNTGPIPPQPNVESTYTVLLSFTSSVNSVAGATMRAVLPSYVRYVSSNDSNVTYDANTRTVTWTAGDVAAGTTATNPKQSAFQVALLPSTSQRGTSPVLVTSITYSGTDRFTKRVLEGTVPEVSTQTSQDPGYQAAFGEIAR